MQDICAMYGYKPNRAGFIHCPIHNEKTPSLRIYSGEGGWHCFGCGVGGSVIDFVMHIFSIDFRQAIMRINDDFGLHLMTSGGDRQQAEQLKRQRAERERLRAEADRRYLEKIKLHRELVSILREHQPEDNGDPMTSAYAAVMFEQSYLEYLLDEMRGGDSY